uniref:HMG box-containing protein 1 n=1 Tax=Gouania willdenowi TaxID=441366 RepID=A0A8C5HAQ2_GOUWI
TVHVEIDITKLREERESVCVCMNADPHQSHNLLHCDEHFPSSPGFPTSDSFVEYDDLPDLQEVQEESESVAAPVFQVGVGVSHQERHTHSAQPLDTLWLTQLAHIATGPQSPLLQDWDHRSGYKSLFDIKVFISFPCSLSRFWVWCPLWEISLTSVLCLHRRAVNVGSAVTSRSSQSDGEGHGLEAFSCPPTAWHCFLKGTQLQFHSDSERMWQDVEDVAINENDSDDETKDRSLQVYGSEGLQLVEQTEVVFFGQAVLQLTFDPRTVGSTPVTARCPLNHPFYVQNKGWSSFYPSLTVRHYGIPCYDMEVGDVCLPPGHRDAKETDDSSVFCVFILSRYDFTPLDSSAVYVLSSMARRNRPASQSTVETITSERQSLKGLHSNSTCHKSTKSQHIGERDGNSATPIKCKRPMNAFMLFAKKFRVEYTQMNPGKDNRAISVLLGEQWKKMQSEERRTFTLLNPDCWKRKRTNSQYKTCI